MQLRKNHPSLDFITADHYISFSQYILVLHACYVYVKTGNSRFNYFALKCYKLLPEVHVLILCCMVLFLQINSLSVYYAHMILD